MSLKDLSQGDFQYYQNYNDKMRNCHEKEFLTEIDPDLMKNFYRGFRKKFKDMVNASMEGGGSTRRKQLLTMNRIFTTTNAVAPGLYYENPKKLAIPTEGTSPVSGALMTAVQNYYMRTTRQKIENQEAIMNAWFFGLGWKKVGYHVASEPAVQEPESELDQADRMSLGARNILGIQPDQLEARGQAQYVRHETLFNTSESPSCVLIDHEGDLRNFKVITHRVRRTLHDLMVFGNYDPDAIDELRERKLIEKGTRFSDREVEVWLNEMTIEQRNGIWVLTFADEFDKPLRYDKSSSQGSMPWSPIHFTYEPGVRYPTSHMRVASQTQEWIDNIANLQIEIVGKARNQHYVNKELLTEGEINALQKNKIGGIILGKRTATAGDIMPINNQQVRQDMFNMLDIFNQNLTEIMGTTSQRVTGSSQNKTLGQDKLAESAAAEREGGLIDRVRDWVIHQSYIEGEILKQYSNATLHLQITPRDFSDPETGRRIEEEWVEFMTPRHPLPLRQYIQGSFDYEINIYEALKINKPLMRREYMELLSVIAQPAIQSAFVQAGVRPRLDVLAEKLGDTFELIDARAFMEKLDPRQQAAIQAMQMLQSSGGKVGETGVASVAAAPQGTV